MLKFAVFWMLWSVGSSLVLGFILHWRVGHVRAFFAHDDALTLREIVNSDSQRVLRFAFLGLFLSFFPALFAVIYLTLIA